MSNDMNITIDEARALVSDAALWPHVRDFLWDFATQVHSSWLEGVEREPLDESQEGNSGSSLVSRLSTSPRVKRFILSSLGVEPCFHTFPKDDWSRLALLDGATLESCAKWLGAIACADGLRRVTDGKTVRELKTALPGVYPEVFGYTAYFTGFDLSAKDEKTATTPEGVVDAGLGLLFSLLGECPASVVSRLKFKLPAPLVSRLPDSGHETRDAGRVGAAVIKLLKLKFPEAYSLCCS